MKNKIVVVVLLVGLIVFSLGACSGNGTPKPGGKPVTDYASLVDTLRAAGGQVEAAGEITQPFFSGQGSVVKVDGGDVQVFEYPDAAAAAADAGTVSADGSAVGTSMVGWLAPPHFYLAEKIIVLYVGDAESVMSRLENAVGAQFAGR